MSDYYDRVLITHTPFLAAQILAEECRGKDEAQARLIEMIHSLVANLARHGIKVQVWPETLEYKIKEE